VDRQNRTANGTARKDSQDRAAITETTVRTVQPRQGSQNMTARTGQENMMRHNRTGNKGLPGTTTRTGLPGRSQHRISRTGLPRQKY
jgi:hypothetical protein